MALPEPVRPYFVGALELAEPVLLEFLSEYDSDDPIWNIQPDPERFNLKFAIAHVADWNDIFRARIEQTLNEDHPTLPDMDEGKIAVERDYEHRDPTESLRTFSVTRRKLIDTVKGLPPEAWSRTAIRLKLGELSMSDQIALITAHDAYHLRQVIDYVRMYKNG